MVYNYLKNLLASYGFVNLEKAISTSFEKREDNSGANDDNKKSNGEYVNIKLIEDRGIIINDADGSRNISFKVDTINSMLEAIYKSVLEISDKEKAVKALFNIGYEGGNQFGKIMNQKWELEEISFETKITKWCEFDSVVGWGKFNNNLSISEEDGSIEGNVSITENFLCNNRRKKDIKLCDFIKGYITGVLEELLNGVSLEITCDVSNCPQDNPFKKECKFELKIN